MTQNESESEQTPPSSSSESLESSAASAAGAAGNSSASSAARSSAAADDDFHPRELRAGTHESAIGAEPKAWFLVSLTMFIVAWGGNEFTPLLVFYRKEHVFSPVFVDSLLVAYSLGIAVGLLFLGPLSDRYGRKPVMFASPAAAIVGSLLIAIGETSEIPMFIGRCFAGLAVGIAMTVGGSWVKELSQAPFNPTAKPSAGAARAAMSLTAGFGIGALVAGVLAQWGPMPGQLPYIVQMILALPTIFLLFKVPESRQSAHLKVKGSFWSDIAVPTAKHPRFLLVAIPIAPWVFGAAGVAYAVTPSLMSSQVSAPIAFASLLTMVALTFGFGIQQVGDKINTDYSARGPITATVFVCVGMAVAAFVSGHRSVGGALIAAAILGLGYGLCMISGLTEVQRLAGPDDLAGLTSIFYVLTYIGFFFPMILTKMSGHFSYEGMLGFGVVESFLTLILLVIVSRKFLPEKETAK